MNYEETITFLYSQLPMYSRIGKAAYKSDLTNTLQLTGLLNHPERSFKSIHIAGTNGKGSTSHILAAMLQQNGYKTGLYTSPHLKDFRERIRINGEMIPEAEVIAFVEQYKEAVLKIGCSFFEWTVGLAFDYFRKSEVDIAVIETGLGGRLDSTNVITPLLSVITNVSYDHTDLLGETLQKIAFEKAGIIKHNIPVVVGEMQDEISTVFKEAAAQHNAPISFASDGWKVVSSNYSRKSLSLVIEGGKELQWKIELDLLGSYQQKNILTVLQARQILMSKGFVLEKANCIEAAGHVKELTGLRGRWDTLSENPIIVADVAHNEAGLQYSLEQIKLYQFHQLHFVIGFVQEKDIRKILQLFPAEAKYYFCRPDIPRGLDANLLKKVAVENGLQGESYSSVHAAFEAAKREAASEDFIYVGGSTFVVAEVI